VAQLSHLTIRDFRNIARADLSLPPEGIAVVGENGHGKTNLLEAVYYFHVLRSMRGARDQDLVRFDAPAFFLSATVQSTTPGATRDTRHELSAAFETRGKRKKIVVDGGETARLSQALGALPSVVVSPRDVELVLGAPSTRRRFLDIVLALTSPRYLAALQAYRNVLARRNAVLRDAARTGRADDSVTVWEPALAEHGATLIAERAEWIAHNAQAFSALCAAIGEQSSVAIRYGTGIPVSWIRRDDKHATPQSGHHTAPHEVQHVARDTIRDALRDALERKRSFDLKRGATHVGPHRDELHLTLGGHDLRTFGSAGQQRTVAIALRMLEASTLREHTGAPPLLLLDDPFAELDPRRAEHILSLLHDSGIGQTILTVPRAGDIPDEFTKLARWRMTNGALTPEQRAGATA